ncbi:MAG TPA: GFA family protein [Stellaceae bacterium]|nr:GFA family protein [Stellaceae bacterium]
MSASAIAAIVRSRAAAPSASLSQFPSRRCRSPDRPRPYDRGDSGKVLHRAFCPQCGSSLFDEAEAMPNVAMIQAGTLDDPSWVKPTMEIFCDSAQPWVQLGGDRKRFPRMPG